MHLKTASHSLGVALIAGILSLSFATGASATDDSLLETTGSATESLTTDALRIDAQQVSGQYIITLDDAASNLDVTSVKTFVQALGGSVSRTYKTAMKGMAVRLPASKLASLESNSKIMSIEADQVVHATDSQSPATWGLDRIDQSALPLSNSYNYDVKGQGVSVYVLDTGIRGTHTDFGSRVSTGYDAINGGGSANTDCNGHGTHVAGTIGGTTYGVAKNVTLVPVRVLDCDKTGLVSDVIAGLEWVEANKATLSVANMSLGTAASDSLDTAVGNLISAGVTVVGSAGNDNADACNASPARVPALLTVGATDNADARWSNSNYGTCLDLFAPGASVTSTWATSDTAAAIVSGTSMASPHVAGVAALYLGSNPTATPATIASGITGGATNSVVTDPGTGSPNKLLNSLYGSCTLLPENYSGSLSGTGTGQYHPNGGNYYSSITGIHRACLAGPGGANFNLYLYKWNGTAWVIVASGVTSGSNEDVSYNGTAGYYTWRVYSQSGSGAYTLKAKRP